MHIINRTVEKLNKNIFFALVIFTLSFIVTIGVYFFAASTSVETTLRATGTSAGVKKQTELSKRKPITIILVGDIMLDRMVESAVENYGGGDFRFPFLKVADELRNSDILFGNLEGTISDKGRKVGSIYSFRDNPEAVRGLSFAGFDVLSLANNHMFDYGKEALEDTFVRLKEWGIDYVGAGLNEGRAYGLVVKEVGRTKIGFLAYTNLGPESWSAKGKSSGIAWIDKNDIKRIKNDIKNAKEKVDILIISLHSGNEYLLNPTEFQVKFSRAAIDAGADLIVGHHPHVVQKNEKYKSGFIFYSLGNFVFDQNFSERTMRGQIVRVLIENKKIKKAEPTYIKINKFFQPEIK